MKNLENLAITAQMIIEDFPCRTIGFFVTVYESVRDQGYMSCSDMGRIYGCTPQAAAKHVALLTNKGYFRRVHYRAWSVDAIKTNNLAIRKLIEVMSHEKN